MRRVIGITGQAGAGKDEVARRLVEEHGYVQLALADPIKRFGYHVFGFSESQLWGPSQRRNEVDHRYGRCDIRQEGLRLGHSSIDDISRVCDPAWALAASRILSYGPIWIQKLCPEQDQDALLASLCAWFETLGDAHSKLSPRVMLQLLGTEWGRDAAGEDVWVRHMLEEAKKVLSGASYDRLRGTGPGARIPEIPEGVVVSDVRFRNELSAIKKAHGKLVRVVRPDTDQLSQQIGIASHASESEQGSFQSHEFDAVIHNGSSLDSLHTTIDHVIRILEIKQ